MEGITSSRGFTVHSGRRHLPAVGLTALDAGTEFWDADRSRRELSAGGYFGESGWPPALTAAADGTGREPCLSAVGGWVI